MIFTQDRCSQPGNFIAQQTQPRLAFILALREFRGGPWEWQLHTRALKPRMDNLVAQFFLRTQRQELHAHLLQARDILLEEFQLFLELQGKQSAQAQMMDPRRLVRIVEYLQIAMRRPVHQCRKTDQGLLALLDFQQFGQFAEGPAGQVAELRISAVAGLCSRLGGNPGYRRRR